MFLITWKGSQKIMFYSLSDLFIDSTVARPYDPGGLYRVEPQGYAGQPGPRGAQPCLLCCRRVGQALEFGLGRTYRRH